VREWFCDFLFLGYPGFGVGVGFGFWGCGIDGSKAGLDMMVVVVVSSLIQVRVVCVWMCGCVYLLAWPAHIDL